MRRLRSSRKIINKPLFALGIGIVPLFIIFMLTLQTIPNGSSHYFMIDVGETQIVLNTWGTLHATGYPLYVIIGNLLTSIMTTLGVAPVTAPALVSLLWGLFALTLVYQLAHHITGRRWASVALMFLLGLTRTVWIHHVIAEIYTFGLLIMIALLALALWKDDIRGLTTAPARIYWLALLGGIGVAHHRAIGMLIPALLYATFPIWKTTWQTHRRQLMTIIGVALALGLLGFAQYLYLPLRAQAGADWVYGDPSTLDGFLQEFLGREANRFIGLPETAEALWENFNMVNTVIITDVTLLGVLAGMTGLVIALLTPKHRRAAITLCLSALVAYLFHVFYYTDILSALILPTTVTLAFGWLFLMDWALAPSPQNTYQRALYLLPLVMGVVLTVLLITRHYTFVRDLTDDTTGVETIAEVARVPENSTLMLAWGPRHFAVGFALDVSGNLQDYVLVDHNADIRALLADDAPIITPSYTFFNQPLAWWTDRAGEPVYLTAIAPNMVAIKTAPTIPESLPDDVDEITRIDERLTCTDTEAFLDVDWYSPEIPESDWSVFVHLVDNNGTVLAQDDQSDPVYGLRPLTTWDTGEVVRDVYTLPRLSDGVLIRYGFYRALPEGGFTNEMAFELVSCDG